MHCRAKVYRIKRFSRYWVFNKIRKNKTENTFSGPNRERTAFSILFLVLLQFFKSSKCFYISYNKHLKPLSISNLNFHKYSLMTSSLFWLISMKGSSCNYYFTVIFASPVGKKPQFDLVKIGLNLTKM